MMPSQFDSFMPRDRVMQTPGYFYPFFQILSGPTRQPCSSFSYSMTASVWATLCFQSNLLRFWSVLRGNGTSLYFWPSLTATTALEQPTLKQYICPSCTSTHSRVQPLLATSLGRVLRMCLLVSAMTFFMMDSGLQSRFYLWLLLWSRAYLLATLLATVQASSLPYLPWPSMRMQRRYSFVFQSSWMKSWFSMRQKLRLPRRLTHTLCPQLYVLGCWLGQSMSEVFLCSFSWEGLVRRCRVEVLRLGLSSSCLPGLELLSRTSFFLLWD